MGDTGALIRLLLSLSSNLHILMEVETICLRMGNSQFATLVFFFSRFYFPGKQKRLLNEILWRAVDFRQCHYVSLSP